MRKHLLEGLLVKGHRHPLVKILISRFIFFIDPKDEISLFIVE